MTTLQKERIVHLRSQGESYARIANELRISENTVKSCCRRNNVSVGTKQEQYTSKDVCDNCECPLLHTPGAKRKRFCSDKCRMMWWKAHPEAVNRKAVYRFACPACGAEFEACGNTHHKYCSRSCFGAARRTSDE